MPVLIEAVPLFVVLSALVLLGLSQSHSSVRGGGGLAGFAAWAYSHTIGATFNLLAAAERWIISKVAASQLRLVAAWFSALAVLWHTYFVAVGEAGEAVAGAVTALDHALPRVIRREVAPVRRLAHGAARKAEAAAADARANARTLERFRAHTNARLRADAHALDVTLPHDIAGLRRRARAIEDEQTKQGGAIADIEHGAADTWDWIKSHPLGAVTGAFAGAVAIALARLGFGFLRCRSWQKLGRSIRCNDANILGDLLALATGVLASQISLEEFIRAGQAIEGEAIDALHLFIRE
jgi:hypothetical protein